MRIIIIRHSVSEYILKTSVKNNMCKMCCNQFVMFLNIN